MTCAADCAGRLQHRFLWRGVRVRLMVPICYVGALKTPWVRILPSPPKFKIMERRLRSGHRSKSDDVPYVTMVSSCALTARTDRESRVGKKRILNRIVKDRVPISQLNKVQRRSAESGTGKVARAGLDINDQYSLA